MNKRFYGIVGLLILSIIIAACGADATTEAPVEAEISEAPAEEADEVEAPAEESEAVEETSSTGSDFVIIAADSSVRFIVDEVLNGSPKTVIGESKNFEGKITTDYANTSATTISEMRIDAGSFVTDSTFRDKSIRNNILQVGQFSTATFTTTSISGLPNSVEVGDTVEVQVTGDLTIHGVTNEVTFDGSITVVSESELSGLLSLEINYEDFGVQILRLPEKVASVSETVILEIEFVARK